MAGLSHLAPAEGLLAMLARGLASLVILQAREAHSLWTFSGHTPTFNQLIYRLYNILGIVWAILGYPWLYPAIPGYLELFWAISGYLA